jgi:exodeoxyribonuclease V
MTQLSDQQMAGIEAVRAWYDHATDHIDRGPGVFRLFGPAGTGKTTLARELPAALGLDSLTNHAAGLGFSERHDRNASVVYGTFTGKAAHVLRSKGASPVSTIHSACYYPAADREAKEALEAALDELEAERAQLSRSIAREAPDTGASEARIAELEAQIPDLRAATRRLAFEWNPDSEWSRAGLIVLDEVSMVNHKLATDIEAYGVPVLVLGDPAQLPPVDGGGYYTNAEPDFLLTEIHRTALDNPITALATRIRTSTDARLGLTREDFTPASVREAMEHDQVICWSNRRRWALITAIRKVRGYPEGEPTAGDRIMCLTNNREAAVFNGQQFEVLKAARDKIGWALTVLDDEGHVREMPAYPDGFLGQDMQEQAKRGYLGGKGSRILATFSQAITAHKAQGSEWDSVYVVNELPRMIGMYARKGKQAEGELEARRWAYTAATRARKTLTITSPGRS